MNVYKKIYRIIGTVTVLFLIKNLTYAVEMHCSKSGTISKINVMVEELTPFIGIKAYEGTALPKEYSKSTHVTVSQHEGSNEFDVTELKRKSILGGWKLTYSAQHPSKAGYIWLFTGKIGKNDYKQEQFVCDYTIIPSGSKYPQATQKFALNNLKILTAAYSIKVCQADKYGIIESSKCGNIANETSRSSASSVICTQSNGGALALTRVNMDVFPYFQFLADERNTKKGIAYIPIEIIFSKFADESLVIAGIEGYDQEKSWSFTYSKDLPNKLEEWHFNGELFGHKFKDEPFNCGTDTLKFIAGSKTFQQFKSLVFEEVGTWVTARDAASANSSSNNKSDEGKKP
jgi:hypothetical protein